MDTKREIKDNGSRPRVDFLVWSIQILSEMFERLNGCSKMKIYIFQSKKIFYFCRDKMLGSIFSTTSVLDIYDSRKLGFGKHQPFIFVRASPTRSK